MKTIIAMLLSTTGLVLAQPESATPFPLWNHAAPGALGTNEVDIPTLTPYYPAPDRMTGAALVVCPGGGYAHLSQHEGKDYALWLNERGIAGFVLKYRLGSNGYRHPAMLQDAARAVRLVRAHAAEWKLDPHRIGIMGSSAGGHLASTLLTHFDAGIPDATDAIERESSRPDLGVLCYAVISLTANFHRGSRENLLGPTPSPELVRELSNELQVRSNTPPCFIWHTYEDKTVPVSNSLVFAQALNQAHVPFDLHIYQKGSHGMGLGARSSAGANYHPWTADLDFWLQAQGWTREPKKERP